MRNISKTITRTLALVLAICASSAWAEVLTYGSTGSSGDGYYLSTDSANPTTVFTSLSLRDMITKYKISGYIGGGWIPEGAVDGVYNAVVGKDTVTVQFQKADGESVKGTIVNFRQSGADITAYAVKYSYKTYSDSATATASLGVDLTVNPTGGGTAPTSDTANGYGIYGITLTSLAAGESPIAVSGVVSKPLAVWNGNFPTTNDGANTHNGYKLSVKGNTAAADGSKITLASSKPGIEILHVNDAGDMIVANTPFAAIYNMYNLTTSGSRMLGTSIAKSGSSIVYNRTMAGLAGTTFNSWHSGGSEGTEQIAKSFSGNATTVYSIGFLYRPSISTGTDLYFDGVHVMEADGIKSGSDANNIYGVSLGGSSGTETRWNFPNAEISYVALLNSEAEAEIAAWSLNSMTSAANFSDSGTISGATDYSAKGINLNGGTVALSGDVTVAAVFVWADTTLSFANGATLTVGGNGLGPIYIADGATLTIDASSCSPAGNAAEDLVKGVFYSKSQVSVKTPAAFGYSVSDLGVQIGKYLKWNYANGIVTWATPSSVANNVDGIANASTKYFPFDASAGEDDTENPYTNGTASGGAYWQHFCYNSNLSTYSAPGYVLRFVPDEGNQYKHANITLRAAALTYGGLIVEDGATNYAIAQDTGDSYPNTRHGALGDPTGGAETWFEINEDFSMTRPSHSLMGTMNVVVNDGATFELKTGNATLGKVWTATTGQPTLTTNGGELKMHGTGTFKMPQLTANGSTLDYSDLAPDRATAYIDGALVINSSTQFKFPASAVWPYKVASSISGLTDGYTTLAAANYTVGGVAGTSPLLLLSNGTAIPAAVLSVTGDTDWSTLANGCTQTAYVLNVTSSATLDIDSAVSGLDVIIFNVDDGCTLTLTGATITADSIRTVGSGSVVMNTSGYDVSGLTEGGYVKVLDGAITGSVGVTAVPAASESLVYYYDIKSDGVYVRAIGKTRRSINANFGNTLSVGTNVGLAGVPGNKWDNFSVDAGTTSHGTVKVVDDANSTTFNCPGLSVEVSGTRGTWNASYTAASDPRQTYIDDNANYTKPTVTITGVPFAKYRAIVYHSTDDNDNKKWGYDTVNGSNYYYDDQKILQTGTFAWGSTSGVAMEEGVNILVTDVMTDPSFVVSGNYHGGNSSARGCIAAVQIVKTDVATIASAGEYTFASLFGSAASTAGDYVINVNESATLNISSDTTVFMVTFNVAEGKTLTITGGTLTGTGSIYINGPGKVVTSTVGQLSGKLKTNAAGLGAGVYELRSWTTPQQYTTTCAGYGTWTVATTGLASGLTAEPVYGAKAVFLRVYNTATQAARKPLVIWPYGDSITEGYNQQHTGTNYRILLYQKLRMLGYNVKSTGVYDLDDGYNAVDPSGTPLTDDDKWHSAKHGAPVSAGLSGLAGRGALIENVDTLCVQAETPDVVLLHIGVNDLSQTSDVDSVFEAWTNVVGRLVRNLPNSKIVVSTALYGRDNQVERNRRVTSYNDKIKALIAAMPAEWVGHVVLADLCSLVDSNTTGILYSLDTVHPDWWGYDQMAEGWLSQVTNLYTNPAAVNFPSQAALPAIPDPSALGAANKSELVDYRAGFTKYGDVRVAHGQDIANIVYTNVDANAAASNIGRVGYFVEYVRTDNHAHKWVWVDMDAFGNRDIASMGLPAATQQQVVKHMHVYSNHGAVDNVDADDDTVSGFIEFTPYNIGAAASSIEGAPADSCPSSNQLDWNDTPSATGYGTYSSMQVFRIAPPSGRPAQTIFGFNNWRDFDSNPAEFGIGNFAQHFWSGNEQTLDYVHTRTSVKMNADAYTVKTIEIWTKPEYTATISAADADFSDVAESASLPEDASSCDLVINVTADATLTFNDTTSVGSIRFNIADGVTLTLDDVANLTVGKVVVSGPGKIAFTASPEFGALRIASDATIALASDQAITLDGALTVESGVTLTMEPATMDALSSDMISAGSVVNNGTIEFTVPDEGSDYSISITGTAVTLRRVTKNAFAYNPVPGENTPSGWITSWGGEPLATTSLRVGPSSAVPYVYHVASGKHPWVALAARTSGFSYAIYADVSQMESDKGVITAFGNTGKGLFLYRDGDYVKLAHVVSKSITTPAWVPGVAVSAGYHLYTVTFDPTTGAAALYLDDGSTYAATDGSTHAHLGTQGLNNGFQLGSVFEGVGDSGFHLGVGMAVCAIRGYDAVLQPEEVETLSESFPATDGNVTWNVAPDNADNTVIVTSATFGDSNYIAQSKGTLTIPAGSEVNVKHIRVLNNGNSNDRATVNIAGTLNITSESTDPNTWNDRNKNKGVLFGHYYGQATYNITGNLIATNTYIETVYTASTQLLDISGGTVKTKALYAGNGNSTVKLRDGGTLEVAEILSSGSAITKEFKYGTFRVTADATETRAINFSAAGGYATTLDPYGNTLTLESAALTGSGDITVADSSDDGDGKVVFVGGSSYTGRLLMTDANAANIDISGYTGTVLCQGTEATTIAMFDGFAGTVYFTGNVNATGIDLSGATVHIADDCTFTADAGSEGTLVLGSGVSVTLNVTEEVANYEGYFPTVSGSGTISYYQTDGTPGELTGADHVNGNNLMPYYNVWVPSANGENNTISADAAARWRLTRLPDANKNVAFKLSGDTTVTIDATITFKDVQVYGTGSLTIQQSGDNVLTVGKGLYTTANTTVQIDSGLAFESGAMLEIESAVASGRYVGVNCGTAESPFEIPFITGSGLLIIAEGKGLTTGSMTVGTLTVQGALALTGTGSATSASVYAGGVIDVSSGTSLAVPALTVNGTVNMGGKTLSATTISGTGRVEYANKLPDTSSWATGTESTGWRGTVAFSQTANLTGPNLNNYGNAYSTVALTGVSGSNTYLPDDDITTNVRIEGPVTINNGNPIDIASGWTQARVVKIASLEVDGALTFVKTGQTSWNNPYKGIYYAEVLKCGADGSINIGNQFGLRVDTVDFAEAPSASSCLVPISLTRGGDDKADGVLYGPNGVAGELIPVTVNGVVNDQMLVHATVNETTGLYLAVASVTVNETTTYYPTLAAVKAAVGNDPVTINILVDVSENIALAYGQVLDKGSTDYKGTVSASDSGAKVVTEGTKYKVIYGTIFSVY